MSRSTVGVIGHVDHGKTALVRALTGQDTDRLPEEKARGISIALGFAHLDEALDLIDMPGHERFVRTMISGATGIDAVLLVVAANEGVQPQTVEHVEIAGLLGIARAIVAVSKCDLVSREEAELVGAEAMELLGRNGFKPLPSAILTSAVSELGIADLRQALISIAERQHSRPALGPLWLPIDRTFTMAGHGTVVTGTLRGNVLAAGDALELLPKRRKVRVRALQVHGAPVASAAPGQRVAVNLRGIELGDVTRGMALVSPGALERSEWLTLSLRALAGAPPLKNGARLRALFGTQEAEARLRLLDRDVLEPGEAGFAQLRFAESVAIPAGEHVVLRRPSPAATVAGGLVLEPVTRRLKRRDGGLLHRLELLRDRSDDPDGAVLTEVEPVKRERLALRPDPERARMDVERASQIGEKLRQAGLTPPLPKEIIVDASSHRAVERLLREGTLIRATDRDKGKELLFHRDAIAEAKAVLAPLLGTKDDGGLAVSQIAAALAVSRKFCMPLLDHLDTIRFTRREGDRRVAGPALRLDS